MIYTEWPARRQIYFTRVTESRVKSFMAKFMQPNVQRKKKILLKKQMLIL